MLCSVVYEGWREWSQVDLGIRAARRRVEEVMMRWLSDDGRGGGPASPQLRL
jgi:hypothetical protein